MLKFEKYRRTNVAEMAEYEEGSLLAPNVSVSDVDYINGSPKKGDMIARNPDNHDDQWLVAQKYFKENFEKINS